MKLAADLLDGEDLGEEAGFPSTPLRDRWLSEVEAQGGQIVGVGLLEVGVIDIEPLHRPFQRAPGVEATGPWGAVGVLLCFASGFVEFGPVGF
ncbi:MAG: hypothetical protein PHR66_02675 [Desulfuromonadaceae bacterium]|nr:hypothetical protein [Desulfuromonadaceae bacterium]